MQEMIKRIVEMDKMAREITAKAQQDKLNCEKDIVENVIVMREELLAKARHRIEINRKTEAEFMEQSWTAKKKEYEEKAAEMENLYTCHGDAWVDELVSRVLQ